MIQIHDPTQHHHLPPSDMSVGLRRDALRRLRGVALGRGRWWRKHGDGYALKVVMERFRFGPDDARRSDRVVGPEWEECWVGSNVDGGSGEIRGDSGTGGEGLWDGDGVRMGDLEAVETVEADEAVEAVEDQEISVSSLEGVVGKHGLLRCSAGRCRTERIACSVELRTAKRTDATSGAGVSSSLLLAWRLEAVVNMMESAE
jgi:hypothetical protein